MNWADPETKKASKMSDLRKLEMAHCHLCFAAAIVGAASAAAGLEAAVIATAVVVAAAAGPYWTDVRSHA